jgi:hypothetical protein
MYTCTPHRDRHLLKNRNTKDGRRINIGDHVMAEKNSRGFHPIPGERLLSTDTNMCIITIIITEKNDDFFGDW